MTGRNELDLADRELWGHRLSQLFGLSVVSAHPLVARGSLSRFGPGETLAIDGRPLDRLHWVLDGAVQMQRGGRPFGVAMPGEAVGAVVAWAGDRQGLSARTSSVTHTLSFPTDRLATWIGGRSPLLEPTLRAAARDTVSLRRQLGGGAGYASAPAREIDLKSAVQRMLLVRAATGGARNARIEAVADLAASASVIELPLGAELWREGDAESHWALLVARGEVVGVATKPQQRFVYGASDSVGVLDALGGAPRWYTATVSRPLRALRLEREALLSVVADHPEFQVDLMQRMGAAALRSWDAMRIDATTSNSERPLARK